MIPGNLPIGNPILHFLSIHLYTKYIALYSSQRDLNFNPSLELHSKPKNSRFVTVKENKRPLKDWNCDRGGLEIKADIFNKHKFFDELKDLLHHLSHRDIPSYETKVKQKVTENLKRKLKVKTEIAALGISIFRFFKTGVAKTASPKPRTLRIWFHKWICKNNWNIW